MQTQSTALAAIVLYLAAPLRIAIPSAPQVIASPCRRTHLIALLFVAAIARTAVLHGTADGFDSDIANAASLASAAIGAVVLAPGISAALLGGAGAAPGAVRARSDSSSPYSCCRRPVSSAPRWWSNEHSSVPDR